MENTELETPNETIARLEDMLAEAQEVIEKQKCKLDLYTPVAWSGGECPVDGWCQVLIFTRGVGVRLSRALEVNWQHHPKEDSLNSNYDVVAYLVVSSPVTYKTKIRY